MSAISMQAACPVISLKPAYSPDDDKVRRLAIKPCHGVMPASFAAMPREKDTAKYPSPIGMP